MYTGTGIRKAASWEDRNEPVTFSIGTVLYFGAQ